MFSGNLFLPIVGCVYSSVLAVSFVLTSTLELISYVSSGPAVSHCAWYCSCMLNKNIYRKAILFENEVLNCINDTHKPTCVCFSLFNSSIKAPSHFPIRGSFSCHIDCKKHCCLLFSNLLLFLLSWHLPLLLITNHKKPCRFPVQRQLKHCPHNGK